MTQRLAQVQLNYDATFDTGAIELWRNVWHRCNWIMTQRLTQVQLNYDAMFDTGAIELWRNVWHRCNCMSIDETERPSIRAVILWVQLLNWWASPLNSITDCGISSLRMRNIVDESLNILEFEAAGALNGQSGKKSRAGMWLDLALMS